MIERSVEYLTHLGAPRSPSQLDPDSCSPAKAIALVVRYEAAVDRIPSVIEREKVVWCPQGDERRFTTFSGPAKEMKPIVRMAFALRYFNDAGSFAAVPFSDFGGKTAREILPDMGIVPEPFWRGRALEEGIPFISYVVALGLGARGPEAWEVARREPGELERIAQVCVASGRSAAEIAYDFEANSVRVRALICRLTDDEFDKLARFHAKTGKPLFQLAAELGLVAA